MGAAYRGIEEVIDSLSQQRLVFVTEGPASADQLLAVGVPAFPLGGFLNGTWEDVQPYLLGADLCALPGVTIDARGLADVTAKHCAPFGATIRSLDLPLKASLLDWLACGGTPEQLYVLVEKQAREWKPEPPKSKYGAVPFRDIDSEPPKRNWIVKNLFGVGEMGVLWGFSGSGKSFLALDLALTIALAAMPGHADLHWFGDYRISPGAVAYVAPEGGQDLRLRVRAWREARGVEPGLDLPFVLYPTSIDLVHPDADAAPLAQDIMAQTAMWSTPLRMIFVDTLARSLAGEDENNTGMTAFIRVCEYLQKQTGAAVVPIHHTGNDRTRERGHTSLRAAVETSIEVAKPETGGPNTWTVRKLKTGVEGDTHRFRLKQMTLAIDDDGDPITSCHVVPTEEREVTKPRKRALKTQETLALRSLWAALDKHGKPAPPELGLPRNVSVVTRDEWRGFLIGALIDPDEDSTGAKARQIMKRARESLEAARIIGRQEPYFWLVREEKE